MKATSLKLSYNTTQISLCDLYSEINELYSEAPNNFFEILSANFTIEQFITNDFHTNYYKHFGRNHEYSLTAVLNAFLFMHLFNISSHKLLVFMLAAFQELRKFCGFNDKTPNESFLSKFKSDFSVEIHSIFDIMAKESISICKEINDSLSDNEKNKDLNALLVYDTSGVEPMVAENNPKFIASEIRRQKQYAKHYKNEDYNPYGAAYKSLPKHSSANPNIKLDFINGHFCYAYKFGLLANGWGIPLSVDFFDEEFYKPFQNKEFESPEEQKYSYDNASLLPVLEGFLQSNPGHFNSFTGDAEFDSYDNYAFLKQAGFSKVFIPINPRNSKKSTANGLTFDEEGQPLCPRDGTPFKDGGSCKGKNRSLRFKKICPKSKLVKGKFRTSCEKPCTSSPCGRMTYIYPEKDFRVFPGLSRASAEFTATYKCRTVIERSLSGIKSNPCIAKPRSLKIKNIKSDIVFSLMAKLVTLFLAYSLKKPEYFKDFTKLRKVI